MPRETKQAKVERAVEVCRRLDEKYGPVECFLDHANPFRLTIAVLLSAQTTDAQVNKVTPALFERFPTPEAMAAATPEEISEYIHSLGGVGRKTANIVMNVGFGIVEGIAVDTHVNRIAHRLALSPKTHEKEPLKTEQDLLRLLPRELWGPVTHQWIKHGRDTCVARGPHCDGCVLEDICPSAHRC